MSPFFSQAKVEADPGCKNQQKKPDNEHKAGPEKHSGYLPVQAKGKPCTPKENQEKNRFNLWHYIRSRLFILSDIWLVWAVGITLVLASYFFYSTRTQSLPSPKEFLLFLAGQPPWDGKNSSALEAFMFWLGISFIVIQGGLNRKVTGRGLQMLLLFMTAVITGAPVVFTLFLWPLGIADKLAWISCYVLAIVMLAML